MGLALIGFQFLRLILAVIIAVLAQYIAIRVFTRMTKKIDEPAELRKGNIAIGILLGAVILSVGTIIASGVSGLAIPSSLDLNQLYAFGLSFFWLLVAVALAVVAQFIALNVFSKINKGIDEEKELKKGNIAVALILGAIMYSIAIVIQAGLPKF